MDNSANSACDKPKNDFDGLYCLNKVYQEADKELNENYKLLASKVDSNVKKALKSSQLAWISDRNSRCSETRGNSFLVGLDYAATTTIKRSQFLQDRLRECNSSGCQNIKLSLLKNCPWASYFVRIINVCRPLSNPSSTASPQPRVVRLRRRRAALCRVAILKSKSNTLCSPCYRKTTMRAWRLCARWAAISSRSSASLIALWSNFVLAIRAIRCCRAGCRNGWKKRG
jgi:uncharacterized protein YecT (DUF1311 family)